MRELNDAKMIGKLYDRNKFSEVMQMIWFILMHIDLKYI